MNRWRARSVSSRARCTRWARHRVRLSGARGEFVLHLQRDVQRERCHQLDQQRADLRESRIVKAWLSLLPEELIATRALSRICCRHIQVDSQSVFSTKFSWK